MLELITIALLQFASFTSVDTATLSANNTSATTTCATDDHGVGGWGDGHAVEDHGVGGWGDGH